MLSDAVTRNERPEISVYWKPGCSSCLKTKEFVEEQGVDFESVNVLEDEDAMQEIFASGLRSIPAVRFRDKYVYAQNLDDIAALLGVSRSHKRLENAALFERWDVLLIKLRRIVGKFDEAHLQERVIPFRDRSVRELAIHVGQIVHAFVGQMVEELIEIKPVHGYVDPDIVTKADILAHLERTHRALQAWREKGGDQSLPERMQTYYGNQPTSQVIERGVWHCAQHARQLDIITAGRLGAELEIGPELYAGLPLPKRLWV
ncbi:glutaredoxin [Pararhizobium capsulatum DSM 1112]|uniref:Glutaredoxin n=1 Tax=Pararhizobium capsulatum DSM 1112 TaxID=1121113 RepID=A0ABU0BZB3_9HYPH|nr:glutaredoxin domain-containing protein [Pararhizobium capsulatum]MDQ0323049.1 glutaredoxin [Pararhizobium capsulatum DSM 1112]